MTKPRKGLKISSAIRRRDGFRRVGAFYDRNASWRMSMRTQVMGLAATVAVLALAPLAHAATDTAAPPHKGSGCFATNTWESWSTTNNGDALLLRINNRDIYRVDLTPGTHASKGADRFLINQVRGSGWICSALDLDLTLSDHMGFRQPLIATKMRKLTPTEIAAIPRKEMP
jgi:hypothetical protein